MNVERPMVWNGLRVRPHARAGRMAVLDVGTSKMCCAIAESRADGGLELLAAGHQIADGMRAGEVVDAEAAEASILAVVHEAEQKAEETLREVVLAVAAGRPQSVLITVETDLGGRAVGDHDIRTLLEHARGEVESEGVAVLHALPVEITLDGSRPLRDARGMTGERLQALVHVVRAAAQPLRTLIACVERCHLEVRTVVAASYASAVACLTEDEARLGALVLDMGGGATGIAHVADGRLRQIDLVPLGGHHVTADLAYGLSTSLAHAERLKTLYGSVAHRACDEVAMLEVPLVGEGAGGRTGEVPRARLTEIIRPRIEEILQLVQARLRARPGFGDQPPRQRLVLTGGGSQLEGVAELACEIFGLPVRLGRPGHLEGAGGPEEQPALAAAAGALALATGDDGGLAYRSARPAPILAARLARLGQWLKENF
jgi:cell division protein FtsA